MGTNEWLQLDLDLYHQMKNLAEKQRNALTADRLDEFILHSSRRQSIQNAISANRKAHPTKAPPRTKGGGKSRDEITKGIRIIEAIQEIDTEIEKLISLKREIFITQMKELRRSQKALRGYGKPTRDSAGRFFESKG